MAEDRIDIKVTDSGADKAATNLRKIADEAERGSTYVERLKANLASINTSAVDKLARASTQASNAMARETAAAAKLATAQAGATVATAKAATEQQRLATETAKTAAAQARAESAQNAAARSALALAAASERAASAKGNLYNRANALKSALDPAYAAQMRFNAEINEANALLAAGAIKMSTYQQAVAAADARLKAFSTDTLPVLGRGMGRAGAQTANIAAQVNDLGVQFAMAAQSGEPLKMVFMALIQQGSQLSYIASTMDGGWKGLTGTIGRMIARFLPLIAVIGVVVGAFKTLQAQFNDNRPADEFVKSLGLTKDELKELGDTSITASDALLGFYDTFMMMTGLNDVVDDVASFFADAWSASLKFIRTVFVGFYGLVKGLLAGIGGLIKNTITILHNAILAIANSVVMVVQDIVNATIGGINLLIRGANNVASIWGGTVAPEIDKVAFGINSVTQGMRSLEAIDVGGAVTDGVREADATLTRFQENWEEASDRRRQARLREKAAGIIEERSDSERAGPRGRVDRTAENRAHALRQVNLELDNELSRMRMLKDERAIQQRMDQITEALAQKRITLTEQETAALRAKVTEVERYRYVQAESDRMMEEIQGPLRTWNALQEAANDNLARGAINQEQFSEAIAMGSRTFQEATDPLYRFNQALEASQRTLGLYGDALEDAIYLEGIRQEYEARGKSIYDATTGALRAEVAALVAKNAALREQQFIQTQMASLLDPILARQEELSSEGAFYAELQRLRDQDQINEEAHQQAKLALWLRYNEMRLNATSDFFGALAQATAHGHGVVGAISKAAAVAQATIDGYVAVQKALASLPPPFNFVAAAAVAVKTGTQVAGILSTNVGSYATGGQFMVGGKGGVDANNINMNVTRGERVTVETVKQQRANDNAAAAPNVEANTKVVNLFDERSFVGAMDSDEGERVVMNIIRRNADGIRSVTGG